MNLAKVEKLKAMIQQAEFLEEATKMLFLEKLPYLNEKKLVDLYEVFEHDLEKRNKLKKRKVEILKNYKVKIKSIYQKAKHLVVSMKEKAVAKIDERELNTLDHELNNL